ncbi:hypothetical protein EJB05_50204, partial [Eragrostis curvula]
MEEDMHIGVHFWRRTPVCYRAPTTIGVIVEYLHLWDILLDLELQHGVNDTHFWRLSSNGVYSAKSAHESMFLGSITFEPYSRIWKTWAPPKCRFFMWLVAHNRCWTAD